MHRQSERGYTDKAHEAMPDEPEPVDAATWRASRRTRIAVTCCREGGQPAAVDQRLGVAYRLGRARELARARAVSSAKRRACDRQRIAAIVRKASR
jgi:hypothetical protein